MFFFGKYWKLLYKVKCSQFFHFFEISTTCHHFWLFHKCNFQKVSYSNGRKKLTTLMSKPFANVICKLLSHEQILMSSLKHAHDHLQNAMSSHEHVFGHSLALVTSMAKSMHMWWKSNLECFNSHSYVFNVVRCWRQRTVETFFSGHHCK